MKCDDLQKNRLSDLHNTTDYFVGSYVPCSVVPAMFLVTIRQGTAYTYPPYISSNMKQCTKTSRYYLIATQCPQSAHNRMTPCCHWSYQDYVPVRLALFFAPPASNLDFSIEIFRTVRITAIFYVVFMFTISSVGNSGKHFRIYVVHMYTCKAFVLLPESDPFRVQDKGPLGRAQGQHGGV